MGRSNVFAVIDGVARTPPLDGRFLDGVTRGALLDAARKEGIPIREEPIRQDTDCQELYLCGTLKEVAPILSVDGRPAPGAGPVRGLLTDAFRRLVAEETGLR